jgi:epoxyqueuosine reductase
MTTRAMLTNEIISQAESYVGIQAGIVRLEDILKGPSYQTQATPEDPGIMTPLDDAQIIDWPPKAQTVLIVGLHHPENDPRLDYWEKGDTWGNRRLWEISELLKLCLREAYDISSYPLPYHVEKGGLFLKDAAVLSGIGIIGRNNLLLHPDWGPRIRLRSMLLEADLKTTEPLQGFSPCENCEGFCQKACPMEAFPHEKFTRPICRKQIHYNVENKVSEGEIGADGKRNLVIKFCRACELSCPVGA